MRHGAGIVRIVNGFSGRRTFILHANTLLLKMLLDLVLQQVTGMVCA
jgi:hypothetical protein